LDAKEQEAGRLRKALAFYADQDTWFAVSLIPDRPCGAIMEDFNETEGLGLKPGKLARTVLGETPTDQAQRALKGES